MRAHLCLSPSDPVAPEPPWLCLRLSLALMITSSSPGLNACRSRQVMSKQSWRLTNRLIQFGNKMGFDGVFYDSREVLILPCAESLDLFGGGDKDCSP